MLDIKEENNVFANGLTPALTKYGLAVTQMIS